ncbi:AEC family transporter [Ectobacillus ponti]|uniref:AEC family transporter n=1 Tax=Ectobacillus ponti TaxID=2961894 RepID=A0AA41XBD7_9BACI|nr:AEC family transporter [Ectobacillus ponti]MCP8968926.1 AEC family transporter [Ectobacillus ponti]
MHWFNLLWEQLLAIYLLAVIGFAAKKKRLFTGQSDQLLMQLILTITLPALIVSALDIPFSRRLLQEFGQLLLMSAFALGSACLIGFLLRRLAKLPSAQKPGYEGSIIFGNQGFIGYAVCSILLGQTGIVYATVFNILYLFLIWTYGMYIFARTSSVMSIRSILWNPGVAATAAGVVLFLLPLSLPKPLHAALQLTGGMTTPLSMLVIGSLIGSVPRQTLRTMIRLPYLWLSASMRLLLLPGLLLWFSVPLPILTVAVLLAGMPSAPTMTLYAMRYGCDTAFPSAAVAVSTLLSMLSIPLLYWLAHS